MHTPNIYSTHISYDISHSPITLADLSNMIRRNYSNETLISINGGSQAINLTSLSNDVNNCIRKVTEHDIRLSMPTNDIEDLKARIDFLEDKIQKLEFLLGDN